MSSPNNMNENLKQELDKYIKRTFTIDEIMAQIPEDERAYTMYIDDMLEFASYFYNLRLRDNNKTK